VPSYAYIEKSNIELFLNTQALRLTVDNNQVVTGAVLQTKDGAEQTMNAKAVILATGGYGRNEEWIKKYHFVNVVSDAFAGATGSGYVMCTDLGADLDAFDFCQCYGGAIPVDGFRYVMEANVCSYPNAIWVDQSGNRVVNEMTTSTTERNTAWKDFAQDNILYIVFEEDQLSAEKSLFSDSSRNDPVDENINILIDLIEKGYVFKADTITELAEMMGAENLPATVEAYNGYAAAGPDAEFDRTEGMTEMIEGPFYAIYTVPKILLTRAGVRCSTKGQPVRPDGTPIEALYLSGEIIGSANIAGYNNYGGSCLGLAATFGRISAQNAVEYIGDSSLIRCATTAFE
jgi:fumarate reductase flavoprotein subunit